MNEKKRLMVPFLVFSLFFLTACQSNSQNNEQTAAPVAQAVADTVKETAKEQAGEKAAEITGQVADKAQEVAQAVVDQAQNVTRSAEKAPQEVVPYKAGIHYETLSRPYDTGDKEHVVVYEFFGYTCPHCSNFQPYMGPWHKKFPNNVKLVRVPVVFHSTWEPYARAYHTAEMMGLVEKTHQAMFDAIHKERKRMRSIEDLARWYHDKFGVNKDEFLSTAKSFAVESKLGQAERLRAAMNVTSTPTLVVDGKYKPDARALGSHRGVIQAGDYLVRRALQEKGLAGKGGQ